jgi:hypothetical protein
MGTVSLARYAGEGKFQRLFAIKVLHPHLATETAFIDMMRDEAHTSPRACITRTSFPSSIWAPMATSITW